MFRGTTVLAVRKEGKTAFAGDGQVTINDTVMKGKAVKVRTMFDSKILAGFAGSAADALALFGRFEEKLDQYSGNLKRSAVELAKEWRTDRYLRKLEAIMLVADKESMFLISGNGDLLEPDDGIAAIGSGGSYALSAGKALVLHSSLDAAQIAEESMKIAASMCIYTNNFITVKTIEE